MSGRKRSGDPTTIRLTIERDTPITLAQARAALAAASKALGGEVGAVRLEALDGNWPAPAGPDR
jgi:hypothetical protein